LDRYDHEKLGIYQVFLLYKYNSQKRLKRHTFIDNIIIIEQHDLH